MRKDNFKYKCICMWSKNDKYGFIPEVRCPVHGKRAKKSLEGTVPYRKSKTQGNKNG